MALALFLLLFVPQSYADSVDGCPQKCGSTEIMFPFGIGDHCSLSPAFEISCTQTPAPIAYLAGTQHQILSISNGNLRINSTPYVSTDCRQRYRDNPKADLNISHISLPENGPFTISDTSNSFVAVGCDLTGVLIDNNKFTSACTSMCMPHTIVANGSCSGDGCCEIAKFPGGTYLEIATAYVNVDSIRSDSMKYIQLYECSYAFIAEKGSFVFSGNYMRDSFRIPDIAMTLDWSIGSVSCSSVSLNVCGENSACVDSDGGTGYLCQCLDGFSGNPYLNGSKGCKDIDECSVMNHIPCVHGAHCIDISPGYKCICPFGRYGDGTLHGSGCKETYQLLIAVIAVLVTCGCVVVILMCGLWLHSASKKHKLMKLHEEYFRQNGGLLLQQQLSFREGGTCSAKIFSLEELKLATKNYCPSRIIGTGGYGTVYKGILEDGTIVAIKRSKIMEKSQINQFINEFIILAQVNHPNIVKLLGCCLEMEVPMLIYEFISNGTLHHHIHENVCSTLISWSSRLRIAVEAAEALSYLHSATSFPVFHRDVKSSNILLDDNYSAKIADFGISRVVPCDRTQISTMVQGTLGYLDPEYFQTCQLTGKSDVYSFGVVLVELLTLQKPVSFERSQKACSLAKYFLSSMETKDLHEFLDNGAIREGSIDELRAVSNLARKCLLPTGYDRPTMKEVAEELALIARSMTQTQVIEDVDDQVLNLNLSEADD